MLPTAVHIGSYICHLTQAVLAASLRIQREEAWDLSRSKNGQLASADYRYVAGLK